jgi:hypothetical protein
MNNKYDTKGMAALVEKIDKDKHMEEIKLQELESVQFLQFKPYNELKHLDQFYDSEDIDHRKLCDETRAFIEGVIESKNKDEVDRLMDDNLHHFIEYVKDYRVRDTFVDLFLDKRDEKKVIFKGKYVHDAIVIIFRRMLDEVFEQEDTEVGYQITDLIKEFHY